MGGSDGTAAGTVRVGKLSTAGEASLASAMIVAGDRLFLLMWNPATGAEPLEVDLDLDHERRYYPLDRKLSQRVSQLARGRGISTETLLNLWVQERLESEARQM